MEDKRQEATVVCAKADASRANIKSTTERRRLLLNNVSRVAFDFRRYDGPDTAQRGQIGGSSVVVKAFMGDTARSIGESR
jgi:hypothetical protein